ncbi:AaceriAFR619Wp [[Ashbya] aceris (nom. inval.)]|nr:AaceriAFR619Wp [[Ashbya] aceris (nom. inval.)]
MAKFSLSPTIVKKDIAYLTSAGINCSGGHQQWKRSRQGAMRALLLAFQLLSVVAALTTINCRLDLSPRQISRKELLRTHLHLYQVGNFSGQPYSAKATLRDSEGRFQFADLPVSHDENSTVYFQLVASSQDYNLKPNRVLVEIQGRGEELEPAVRAFQNVFGREHFPSPEIVYPEQLVELEVEPELVISYVHAAPLRNYIVTRRGGILDSGPLAGIFRSKYKLAAVVTILALLLFPMLVEKFDPATVEAIKEQRLSQTREKYAAVSETK